MVVLAAFGLHACPTAFYRLQTIDTRIDMHAAPPRRDPDPMNSPPKPPRFELFDYRQFAARNDTAIREVPQDDRW